MCLIIYAKDARPKPEYIENGFSNHPDGTSIAWQEGDFIHYKKDITLEECKKMAAELPLGYVIHCRWASVGGKDKSLIHPFPVRKDVPLRVEGKTKRVLFHNGHWNDWSNVLVNHLTSRVLLPKGKWSDTRAISFLVSVHGNNVLNLLSKAGKFVVMSSARTSTFGTFILHEGVYYSNDSYNRLTRFRGTGVTTVGVGQQSYNLPSTAGTCDPCTAGKLTPPTLSSTEAFHLASTHEADIKVNDREALTTAEYDEVLRYYEGQVVN